MLLKESIKTQFRELFEKNENYNLFWSILACLGFRQWDASVFLTSVRTASNPQDELYQMQGRETLANPIFMHSLHFRKSGMFQKK